MATPLHSRSEVGLRPPRSVSRNVTSEGDSAHYGGPSPWGSSADRSSPERFAATTDHARCASIWRAWQAFHMDTRGWVDIAYSSGVCPHGHRYDGRGPGVRTAAQGTNAGNNRSLATVYIAGDDDPLTPAAKRAFLDEGRRLARLRWGHRDWKSTACPGEPLYAWRRSGWPAPAGASPAPAPEPVPVPEEDDMPAATVFEVDDKLWLCDGMYRREIRRGDVDTAVYVGWAKPGDKGEHVRKATGELAEVVMRCPVVPPTVDTTLRYYEAKGESPLHRILGQTSDAQSSA